MSVGVGVSANLEDNDEKIRGSPKTSQSSNKMFSIGRELCFFLLIIFTTYASFNSNNTGAGPSPTPFFPRGSLVGDFYKGELTGALLRASESDVSFLMYYAPWDAESQATRSHFETVAQLHYKQVYFAGVNCWHPRGDCKRTLSKIQQFPKLVAYVTHETGVEYRGPRDAQYMSAFIEGVMRPLHRLHSPSDLNRLRSSYNAVVVAYLNFKGLQGGPPYRAMYEAALKHLERDVRQEVAFAIVTSFRTTLDMGVNMTPCIKLYLWNETLQYRGLFSGDKLTDWVRSRLHQVSLWLSPPGVKSLTLAPYVTQGPALLMFTPFHNYAMYNLLREVGLEYYNCNHSSAVTQLAQNISIYVSERISAARRALLSCQSHLQDHLTTRTIQIVNNVWTNTSCGRRRLSSSSMQCYSSAAAASQCGGGKPGLFRNTVTSMVTGEEDPLGAGALSQWVWKERCRTLVPPPPRPATSTLPPAIRGLACTTNTSVNLLALDSALFSHFSQGLGVNLDAAKDNTQVLLLNSQMETTHVLQGPITRASLAQFLVNFTQGGLERFQRSHAQPSPPSPSPTIISVTELSTETFLPVVFNDSMSVVVLMYTGYCAFCQAVGPAFLAAARALRSVPHLTFTRVDAESNDLPWQFTPTHYPTILFFPARRKAESRLFPAGVGVTVDSLTQFVLANLPLELRLVAMLQLCQHYPDLQGAAWRRCMAGVRREVSDAIASQLSQYHSLSLRQNTSRELRAEMGRRLIKLQGLRQLQFALSVDSSRASLLSQQFLSQLTENKDSTTEPPTTHQTHTRDEL